MNKLFALFIFIILLSSCNKKESDFIWEKIYGKGQALYIKTSSDSGLIACGEVSGTPFLIRLNKVRGPIFQYKAEYEGLYSSVWFDKSGYLTGGNSDGKMILAHFSPKGRKLWDKSIDAGFEIDYSRLLYTGDGNLLAIGTANPDSMNTSAHGLLFVKFDTAGQSFTLQKIPETNFISANEAALDNKGNVYLALTRKGTGLKTKASVAKYNDLFQKIWETDLFNNPDFGAASMAITIDVSGTIFVAGRTELTSTNGVLNNSFLASLNQSGSVIWKKYLEKSNEGSSIVFDEAKNLMVLNKNCFIINVLSPDDGADAGRIRAFSMCDSENSDARGFDLDINYDKNILIAGSRGGNFYFSLKSSR